MIKKIALIFLTLIVTNLSALSYEPCVPKGTLVKVYTKRPLTTQHLELGSIVYFINPSDVWVLEKKAISKGEIFKGQVTLLRMPVQGVNAALGITITEIINPKDGTRKNLSGRIIFPSGDVLGGNLTNPASYNTTIHPRKVYGNIWGGSLQYVPSGEYEFGRHVTINQRDNIFVQIDEDYYI